MTRYSANGVLQICKTFIAGSIPAVASGLSRDLACADDLTDDRTALDTWRAASISQLTPSADAIRAFTELVASLRVDGVGGDQTSRTVAMHIVGDVPTGKRVEFPESTMERVHDVSRELFAEQQVQRTFQYREVQDLIFRAAISARVDGGAARAEDELRQTYREIGRDPKPIRMLFQVAPRVFFPEDQVKIGDVTLFRGTDSALAQRWPGVARLSTGSRDPFLEGIKGRLVAEFTVAASPGRAEEIAAQRLMGTLGVVGIAYAQLFHDWRSSETGCRLPPL